MTVQELIDELQKVKNKELYIRIHGTGPDGWTYYNMVEFTSEEVIFEDDGEYGQYRKRFVISGGMF